ncbi:MAG TPA: branched-chain amino acid ABC transporter ATP-binding protein/permease [Paenalcaligenes sp.]|nr:branched-chain amino acid ABC transporter ATP-binding protein/permease [Paenalcaligenes sp.]
MRRWIFVPLIVILAVLPLWSGMPEFWITQLNYIGLSSLVVLGLVVLTGVAGLTSFGQAAFVGIGAYTTAWLSTQMGWSPWAGLVVALVLTAVFAFIIGTVTMRLSGHYLPLGTIAWSLSIYYLFGNLAFLGQHDGISGIPAIDLFGISFGRGRSIYYLIWIAVLLAMWATYNLMHSRPGRAIRALRQRGAMAESFGINTARYKVIVFIYAALLACVSGWLYAHMQRAVSPSPFGLNYGIEYLFMAVIGGASSVWGAVLGSSVILIIKDRLQNILPLFLDDNINAELIVFGVLMILILQYASQGLWSFLAQGWEFIWQRLGGKPLTNEERYSALQLGELTTPTQDDASRSTAQPSSEGGLEHRSLPPAETPVLELNQLRKEFGGLVAVNDLSFGIKAGEIVGLIGPNGAGKSTCFNLITGVLPRTSGEVRFLGQEIQNLNARQIAQLGISRSFQHVQLAPNMTVLENVALGAYLRESAGVLRAFVHAERRVEGRLLHEARRQLQRVGLLDMQYESAGRLALGQQRILEIARALASDPILLMLDEPAAGLRYREKQALGDVLRQLSSEGVSILLVEHDMEFVMGLTDHIVVMNFGTKLAEGTPQSVQSNPDVLEAYLGGVVETA